MSLDLGVACTDAFEDSDTRLTAANLPFGTTAGLTACPADDDWYRIDIAANRRLVADATFTHADGNIDLTAHVVRPPVGTPQTRPMTAPVALIS